MGSARSRHAQFVPVRASFKWLTKQNYTLFNPASEIELPKLDKTLLRETLTADEVDAVLAAIGHADLASTEIYTQVSIAVSSRRSIRRHTRERRRGRGAREVQQSGLAGARDVAVGTSGLTGPTGRPWLRPARFSYFLPINAVQESYFSNTCF